MKHIRPFLQGAVVILFLVGTTYFLFWFHHWSRATMHNDLVSDMKMADDAPIPCRNLSGEFYLFTYDVTYGKWMEIRNRGENTN